MRLDGASLTSGSESLDDANGADRRSVSSTSSSSSSSSGAMSATRLRRGISQFRFRRRRSLTGAESDSDSDDESSSEDEEDDRDEYGDETEAMDRPARAVVADEEEHEASWVMEVDDDQLDDVLAAIRELHPPPGVTLLSVETPPATVSALGAPIVYPCMPLPLLDMPQKLHASLQEMAAISEPAPFRITPTADVCPSSRPRNLWMPIISVRLRWSDLNVHAPGSVLAAVAATVDGISVSVPVDLSRVPSSGPYGTMHAAMAPSHTSSNATAGSTIFSGVAQALGFSSVPAMPEIMEVDPSLSRVASASTPSVSLHGLPSFGATPVVGATTSRRTDDSRSAFSESAGLSSLESILHAESLPGSLTTATDGYPVTDNDRLAALFHAAYGLLMYKLRMAAPCTVCALRSQLALPEPEVVELVVTGMVIREVNLAITDGSISPSAAEDIAPAGDAEELAGPVAAPASTFPLSTYAGLLLPRSLAGQHAMSCRSFSQALKSEWTAFTAWERSLHVATATNNSRNLPHAPVATTVAGCLSKAHAPTDRFDISTARRVLAHKAFTSQPQPTVNNRDVEITPLSYVPGARVKRYIGSVHLNFIRESMAIRRIGLSTFLHTFIAEANAVLRGHAIALGGNCVLAYRLVPRESSGKANQAYHFITLSGDVVELE